VRRSRSVGSLPAGFVLAFGFASSALVLGCGDLGKDAPAPKPVGSVLVAPPRAESAGSEAVPQSHLPSKRRAPTLPDGTDDDADSDGPGAAPEDEGDPLTPPPVVAPPPGGPGTTLLANGSMTMRTTKTIRSTPTHAAPTWLRSARPLSALLPCLVCAAGIPVFMLLAACNPALPGRPVGPPPEYEPPRAWSNAPQTPAAPESPAPPAPPVPPAAPAPSVSTSTAAPASGSAAPVGLPMN
jgi:hypothetical protein